MGRFAPTPYALAAAAVAAGCTPRMPLSEVPVTGGTPTERQIARETMLTFDQDVGPGRVVLESMSFEDPVGDAWGQYSRDRIKIRPGLGEDVIARVVRHELCHAIDHAETLSDPAPDPVDDLKFVAEPLSLYATDEGETLAMYCELGSFPARVLADPCPEDDPRVNAMARWLVDTIWTASHPGYTLEPSDAALDLAGEPDVVTLYGSQIEPTAARVEYTTTAEPDLGT